MAYLTKLMVFFSFNFFIIFLRWVSTVFVLIYNCSLISLPLYSNEIKVMISNSRPVKRVFMVGFNLINFGLSFVTLLNIFFPDDFTKIFFTSIDRLNGFDDIFSGTLFSQIATGTQFHDFFY